MSEGDLSAALPQHFSSPAFRPGQAAAPQHILSSRNTLVVISSVSGKSPIYQLAELQLAYNQRNPSGNS